MSIGGSTSSEVGEDYLPALVNPKEEEEEVGEYYFESDPLALRDNHDYQLMLRALVRLQTQRAKAVRDMERLQEAREEALQDPLAFVTALQNGVNLNLPVPQEIAQIPNIEWEKYNIASLTQGMRPKTRKRIHQETMGEHQLSQDSKSSLHTDSKILVRGRAYDSSKPQTFNQSWSDEEQRKLEELLIKYPDEPIASRRYVKISKELGTRTPLQVQSRVQKFFIALKRDGLPVPGRNPKETIMRRWGGKKRLTNHHAIMSKRGHPQSVFMKAFQMYDDEDQKPTNLSDMEGRQDDIHSVSPYVSDEEDIAGELRQSEEYQELLKMKHIKSMKEQEMNTGVVLHYGYSCDSCGVEPITGPRWHCEECPDDASVDLCEACVKTSFTSDTHTASHKLLLRKALSIKDSLASTL